MKGIHLPMLGALCLLAATNAWPDVIRLKDGRSQEGLITEDRPDVASVKIRTAAGDFAVARGKIASIDKEPESASRVRLGDQLSAAGRQREAMDEYRRALELDKTNTTAAARLEKAREDLGDVDKSKALETDAKLAGAINDALALARKKKFENAQQLMKQNDPGETAESALEYRKAYSQICQMWGADRADRQDYGGAAEKLQQALRFDPGNALARQQIIRAREGDPSKLNEVIGAYRTSTKPGDRSKLAEALFKAKNYE
jgi:tetratricopeptide (TPR) repeat protein